MSSSSESSDGEGSPTSPEIPLQPQKRHLGKRTRKRVIDSDNEEGFQDEVLSASMKDSKYMLLVARGLS